MSPDRLRAWGASRRLAKGGAPELIRQLVNLCKSCANVFPFAVRGAPVRTAIHRLL